MNYIDCHPGKRKIYSPTVILFWVKVPVLSEQIVLQLPRVSTASKFLTKIIRFASLFAVRVNATVKVGNNPKLYDCKMGR